MHPVGDQGLRLGQHAHGDLRAAQRHIHAHAHPGAARAGRGAFRGAEGRVFGVVVEMVELHVEWS
jgi:hypothetical protein